MLRDGFISSDDALAIVTDKISEVEVSEKVVVVDVFCGAGGMTAGAKAYAQKKGMSLDVGFAADSDADAKNVYLDNFSLCPDRFFEGDVSKFFQSPGKPLSRKEREAKLKAGPVDVLFAGPPCQGHSSLNNSTRGMDPRNELYFIVPRAVEVFRPDLVVIENVPGVVHSKERVVHRSIEYLEKSGYHVEDIVVDFLRLGVPQARRRHILVAGKKDKHFKFEISPNWKLVDRAPVLKNWLARLPNKLDEVLDYQAGISADNKKRIDYLFDNDLYDLPNFLRPDCHSKKKHSYNSVYGRLSWEKAAQTITSGFGSMGQGRYIHPSERRTLTAREAMRIQAFPDWYSFRSVSKVTAVRQLIANAVPSLLTYFILESFFESKNN